MPRYSVLIHGKNIIVPLGDETAIGFYTTSHTFVRTPEEVAKKCVAELFQEEKVEGIISTTWEKNPDIEANIGAESVEKVSFYKGLASNRTGYTFYPK